MAAIDDTQARSARQLNLRTLLAGGTATTALIAGAVIVFVSLAAYVAFDGLLGGGEDAGEETVLLGPSSSAAPEAAAAALADTPGAVAAAPAAPTAVAPAPAPAPLAPELVAATSAPPTAPAPAGVQASAPGGGGGQPPAPATAGEGPLGGAVTELEGTTDQLGLGLPLDDLTSPLTEPLDQAVTDTLNGVGGVLGQPNLGTDVNQGLQNTVGGLVGPG
jgi:hypothetical protein